MADRSRRGVPLGAKTSPGPRCILFFAPRFDRVHRHCAALLERGLEVHFVTEVSRLPEISRDRQFAAAVIFCPVSRTALDPLLANLREPTGQGSRLSLVLLVRRAQLHRAQDLLPRDAGRVLVDSTPPEVLAEWVVDLLRRAPRAQLNVPARLEIRRPGGALVRWGRTVNLSTSGVLVRTSLPVPLGSTLRVQLQLAEFGPPVTGIARLARHARPERDGLEGVAARFHSFERDSEARLQAMLSAGP